MIHFYYDESVPKDDRINIHSHKAFSQLKEEDGSLSECPIEVEALYDLRKMHEVCINHRLANHLEDFVLALLSGDRETYFVDIKINREGTNYEDARVEGKEERMRPDIIIHNRKSGDGKHNFLVVKCKKDDAEEDEIAYDAKKIKALLVDRKYSYQSGLQVIYSKAKIKGTLFCSHRVTFLKNVYFCYQSSDFNGIKRERFHFHMFICPNDFYRKSSTRKKCLCRCFVEILKERKSIFSCQRTSALFKLSPTKIFGHGWT